MMFLAETIFHRSKPIGVVRRCSKSNQVAFSPINGPSLVPDREWESVDQLKAAVNRAYQNDDG